MAWTIPSGYVFVDNSASKFYEAGDTFNGTIANGDYMYPSSSKSKPHYHYYSSRTISPSVYSSSDPESVRKITLSAGWQLNIQPNSTFTSFTPLSTESLGNKPIIEISIFSDNDKVTTINSIPPKLESLKLYGTSITTIKGTMPSSLKYFNAYKCSTLKTVPSFSACTKWVYGFCAFQGTSLTSAPALPTGLKYANSMFSECTKLTKASTIPSSVIYAYGMYKDCTALTAAPTNNSTVMETMNYIFSGCTALTTASNFTTKGSAMYAFHNCTSLTNLPTISNTTTNLNSAFYNCSSLTSLPDVPSSVTTLDYAFYGCSSVVNPPTISSNANWTRTFQNCSSLMSTPSFPSNLHSLSYCFSGCTNLTTIQNLPNSITNMNYAFSGCTSLSSIPQLPSSITNLAYTFNNCIGLTNQNIYIPTTILSISGMLNGCSNYSGIITFGRCPNSYELAFHNTLGPIILTGEASQNALAVENNVFIELNIKIDEYTTTRYSAIPEFILTTDTEVDENKVYFVYNVEKEIYEVVIQPDPEINPHDNNYYERIEGTPSDTGPVTKITINFQTPVPVDSTLYIPEIYVRNKQQAPLCNWVLTNLDTGEFIEISNSMILERAVACDLIAHGRFETYVTASNNNVTYKINIPSSAEDVWQNTTLGLIQAVKVWAGISGSAIYTGDTYIFDALPDGSAFKIGGAVDDTDPQNKEKGFIVGNKTIDPTLLYPSTFNGPAIFNETVLLDLKIDSEASADNPATSGADMDLFNIIRALQWYDDVIE